MDTEDGHGRRCLSFPILQEDLGIKHVDTTKKSFMLRHALRKEKISIQISQNLYLVTHGVLFMLLSLLSQSSPLVCNKAGALLEGISPFSPEKNVLD